MAKLVKTILHAVCRHKIAATQETDSKNLLLKSIKETEAGLQQLLLSLSFLFSLLFSTVFGQVCLRAFYTFLMQCGARLQLQLAN